MFVYKTEHLLLTPNYFIVNSENYTSKTRYNNILCWVNFIHNISLVSYTKNALYIKLLILYAFKNS